MGISKIIFEVFVLGVPSDNNPVAFDSICMVNWMIDRVIILNTYFNCALLADVGVIPAGKLK